MLHTADPLIVWAGFFASATAIVLSGIRLSHYGDVIAEKLGMGRAWIGLMLMASVTSLPELVSGISAVTYADAPDIAAGDIFGSCAINLVILAFIDALHRDGPLSSRANQGHILTAAFGVVLIGIAASGIFLGNAIGAFGWVSPLSFIIVGIYLVGIRLAYLHERKAIAKYVKEAAEESLYKDLTLKTAVRRYAMHACVVVAAAVFLPELGARIAELTGLGQSFVGTVLIAGSTSLPEVVVSISAVRIGAIDLAIGNIFGSNIFNLFILGVDDAFYTKGPLLAHISKAHMISALAAMVMTAIAIAGLIYRAEKKRMPLAWDSAAIIGVYLMSMTALYISR